jgi:3-mercaptopyruvate sulfurtransferase SseA
MNKYIIKSETYDGVIDAAGFHMHGDGVVFYDDENLFIAYIRNVYSVVKHDNN